MYPKFKNKTILFSLNRYERKKNINLAIESFAEFKHKYPQSAHDTILIIAGGYDTRLPENVEHHEELINLAKELQVDEETFFLRSITNEQRITLLKDSKVLLYTP